MRILTCDRLNAEDQHHAGVALDIDLKQLATVGISIVPLIREDDF